MKIIVIHNAYLFMGGEDSVARQEISLLRSRGHTVLEFFRTNKEIRQTKLGGFFSSLLSFIWSRKSYRELLNVLNREKPEVAHIHNTFFVLSPSVYYACKKVNVPIVQSIHNPRLMCPAGSLGRNGIICTKCIGKSIPFLGIRYKCYKKSYVYSAMMVLVLSIHNYLQTWNKTIAIFIVFSDFYRNLLAIKNVTKDRIFVKPHFVSPDPNPERIQFNKRGHAIFIGRFDPQKGIRTLLAAWKNIPNTTLIVCGTGQLSSEVQTCITERGNSNIVLMGHLCHEEVLKLIKASRYLVFPSEWYETFGLVLIEAFACGIPVIASNLGVIPEIVKDGATGLLFKAGNVSDLVQKVLWAEENRTAMIEMGIRARKDFEERFSAEKNYGMLVSIYKKAIDMKNKPSL